MASRSLSDLDPHFLPKANTFLYSLTENGMDFVITCTLRSLKEQAAAYAQGRDSPGKIVTNAKPGDSAHNYGLAMDVYPLINGKLCTSMPEGDNVSDPIWQTFGRVAKDCGLEWGGTWIQRDGPHVQLPNWKKYI